MDTVSQLYGRNKYVLIVSVCIVYLDDTDITCGRDRRYFKANGADDRDGWIEALKEASRVVVSSSIEVGDMT